MATVFPLFCVKTFEFAIQTYQTSLGHQYVFVKTYFLSQLRKTLILLIRSHCKICPFPTLRSRVFVLLANCWQWAVFTMGSNEQKQHFAELRQRVCLYKHVMVLRRGLPSLDCKLERFAVKLYMQYKVKKKLFKHFKKVSGRTKGNLFKHHWCSEEVCQVWIANSNVLPSNYTCNIK